MCPMRWSGSNAAEPGGETIAEDLSKEKGSKGIYAYHNGTGSMSNEMEWNYCCCGTRK